MKRLWFDLWKAADHQQACEIRQLDEDSHIARSSDGGSTSPRSRGPNSETASDTASDPASNTDNISLHVAASSKSVSPFYNPGGVDLAAKLQCIIGHKIAGHGTARLFELRCLLQDNTRLWIQEAVIQRASNAAVCTYWGCGPEPWKRPRSAESGVLPGLLRIMGHKVAKAASGARIEKLRVQVVGHPVSPAKWLSGDMVSDNWPGAYEDYWRTIATSPPFTGSLPALQAKPEDELETIISHRLFLGNKDPEFQLQCRWASGDETWEYETDLQRLESVAVLTYWDSDPGARKGHIPERYLTILSHEWRDGALYLRVQWVGSSACLKDTTLEEVTKAMDEWPTGCHEYLEKHNMWN